MGDRTPYEYLAADELDRAALHVSLSPFPTAFTLIRDALQGGRLGTPAVWRKAVLARVRARDIETFAPLTDADTTGWPTLLDDVPPARETIDEALQRTDAITGAQLIEALDSDRDVTPAPAWTAVRRDPDGWLERYVDAIHRGWEGLEPLWQRSLDRLHREVERIDAAVDRKTPVTQLIIGAVPRMTLVDDALRLVPSDEPRRLEIPGRGVTIVPMIAGPKACTGSSPGDHWVRLAYALPNSWVTLDEELPAPASLRALLGPQRAALLMRLDAAQHAGALAQSVDLTPAAISFHLRALESAGLVRRERMGRNIVVRRTSRGTELLALYALP